MTTLNAGEGKVSKDRILAAIDLIQGHIREDYIVEGCRDERVAGCVSCAMIRLDEDLNMLRYEIESAAIDVLLTPKDPNQGEKE